jgi:DNA sulfur modification protein DndC
VRQLELITLAELHEIRRIWVVDKHELEDRLPTIFRDITGEEFPGSRIDDNLPFGAEEMEVLKRICGDDELHFQLTRELIDVERRHRTLTRRTGLFPALERAFRRGYYADADDARERAQGRLDADTPATDLESVGSA